MDADPNSVMGNCLLRLVPALRDQFARNYKHQLRRTQSNRDPDGAGMRLGAPEVGQGHFMLSSGLRDLTGVFNMSRSKGQSLLMHDRIESEPDRHQHHCNQLQTGSKQRQRLMIDLSRVQPVTDDRYARCEFATTPTER